MYNASDVHETAFAKSRSREVDMPDSPCVDVDPLVHVDLTKGQIHRYMLCMASKSENDRA